MALKLSGRKFCLPLWKLLPVNITAPCLKSDPRITIIAPLRVNPSELTALVTSSMLQKTPYVSILFWLWFSFYFFYNLYFSCNIRRKIFTKKFTKFSTKKFQIFFRKDFQNRWLFLFIFLFFQNIVLICLADGGKIRFFWPASMRVETL